MKTRICPVCGGYYTPRGNRQKYCSPKCARAAATEKGYDRIKARTALKAKQNPYLLYAFNFECAVCKWSLGGFDFGGKIEVARGCEFHHITPVAEGGKNDESNLVLLCPNCHKKAHAGLLTREELRRHTFTKEQCEEARQRWALALGVGTYWIDNLTINRGEFKRKLQNNEEF